MARTIRLAGRSKRKDVMLSPCAFPLRTALSGAKGLRVNCAKHLLFL